MNSTATFYRKGRLITSISACLLFLSFSLFAQKTDTLGRDSTINGSSGPIIRSGTTSPQYSYAVYLYTEAELVAKGIYPGATIRAVGWQRAAGNYNPTLQAGATAAWKISVKDGGTQTKYVNGNNLYDYITKGFTAFGSVNFDDVSNNLPNLQRQWMTVTSASGYVYKGGSLEILADWALTSVTGAVETPTSTGAINWYASAVPEARVLYNTSNTAITAPSSTNLFISSSRPNIIITYTPARDCSGTPPISTTTDSSKYCPGKTYVNLYLSDFKPAPGVTIQWQSSAAGANNFSNMANATTTQARDTITVDREYRAVVTCAISKLSSTTLVRSISITPAAATPIEELFSTAVIPSCWSMSSSNSNAAGAWLFTGNPTGGATTAINGRTSGSFAWTDNSYNAANKTLSMPLVTLAGLTNPQLKFDLFSNYLEYPGSEATFKVDVLDNNVWTTILTNKGSKTTWRTYLVPLTAYAGKSIQIRFVVDETATQVATNDLLLDAVSIREAPKCPEPTDIRVSNLTPVSATLNWTENGTATSWQVAYDTGVVNTATAKTIVTSTRPLVLNSLLLASSYQVYVRAICGPGDTSQWSSIMQPFTTLCPVSYTPTYTQDFAKWPAPCWETKVGLPGTTLSTPTTSNWKQANWMHSGTNKAAEINLFGVNKYEWLISPSLDLGSGSGTKYQLDFDLAFLDYAATPTVVGNADDTFSVIISKDNGLSWQRADAIAKWTMNNTPFPEGNRHIVLDLGSYSGVVKIGFYAGSWTAGGNSYIAIDNISISAIPSCRVPINAAAKKVTHKSAEISWEETGTATQWQIEYGPAGFKPGSGQTLVTSTNPQALNTLNHSTPYDFYVRSICGSNDTSARSSLKSFTTNCISDIPYFENFDASNTLPVCMSRENFLPVANNGFKVSTTSSNAYSKPNYLLFDSYEASPDRANNWVFTPGLSLGADTSYSITFTYRSQYPTGWPDSFEVKMGSANTAASMDATPLFASRVDTNLWVTALVKVTPKVAGIYYLGFHCVSTTGYSLFFDNIGVAKTFVCYPPTNLNASAVTTSSADLSWTENSGASQWIVEYGPAGFTPGTGISTKTSNNPFAITSGLNDSTKYDFYVRSMCSPGDTSKLSAGQSFSSLCVNPAVDLGKDTTLCAPYILEANSLGLTYLWSTGEQTASIITKTSGDYWLKVSKTNGCSMSDTINLTLVAQPSVDSITHKFNSDKEVQFNVHTQSDISSYLWNFGDGKSSTVADPVHIYTTAGTYTVSLTVTNMCGVDSMETEVTIKKEEEPIGITAISATDQNVRIFPNPANDVVFIENKSNQLMKSVSLINVSGSVVFETNDIVKKQYRVPTSHLAPGIYFIRMVMETGVVLRKLELLR